MGFNKISITPSQNTQYLSGFLEKLDKESKESFRYFDKRDFKVLDNHLTTIGLIDGESDQMIAYGHLDEESGIVWLGIVVNADYQGKGLGKQIMNHLLEFAQSKRINTIQLSVDRVNKTAIRLYEKFGFEIVKEVDYYILMRKTFLN